MNAARRRLPPFPSTDAARAALLDVDALTIAQARALQDACRGTVQASGGPIAPRTVAGVDVSVVGQRARAAVVVLAFPSLDVLECASARTAVRFPYVPGLLAFREVPAIARAMRRLRTRPDLLLVDGHGFAHPRRFGLACHLGVALDLPAIGVGKTRFIGAHAEPGPRRGAHVALRADGAVIGRVLRTREGVKPIYVSIGHRVDLASAVRLVRRCCTRYRLPEPIRAAHRAASLVRSAAATA